MDKLATTLVFLGLVLSIFILISCGDTGLETTPQGTTNAELKELVNKAIESQGDDADLNDIDTSTVTDMSGVFHNKDNFNGDISKWDVSNVKNFSFMFAGAKVFNGDLSSWQIGKNLQATDEINMRNMFAGTLKFNGDISKWDVSKVTNTREMFVSAQAFNGDISEWDVSSVTDISFMFGLATAFKQDLEKWGSKLTKVKIWSSALGVYVFGNSGLNGNEPSWCTSANQCKP